MSQEKLSKKLKRKTVTQEHDRHCQYWAGCNPFTAEEGYCDCSLSETEPEVYVVLEEAPTSLKKQPKKVRE